MIKDLIQTKNQLTKKVEKVNDLYVAKENSLQELQGLNYAINNAALFANIKEDGTVLYMSKKFIKLLSCENEHQGLSIDDLLLTDNDEGISIKQLIENHQAYPLDRRGYSIDSNRYKIVVGNDCCSNESGEDE